MISFLESFRLVASERIKNPFWGSFMVAWLIINYQFFLALLFSNGYVEVTQNISSIYSIQPFPCTADPKDWGIFLYFLIVGPIAKVLLYPLLSAVIFVWFMPQWLFKIYSKSKEYEKKYIDEKNIHSDTSVSEERASLMRKQIINLKEDVNNLSSFAEKEKEELLMQQAEIQESAIQRTIKETKNSLEPVISYGETLADKLISVRKVLGIDLLAERHVETLKTIVELHDGSPMEESEGITVGQLRNATNKGIDYIESELETLKENGMLLVYPRESGEIGVKLRWKYKLHDIDEVIPTPLGEVVIKIINKKYLEDLKLPS